MLCGKRRMRTIHVNDIRDAVARLCIKANTFLPEDVKEALFQAKNTERAALAQTILGDIIENYHMAEERAMPVCQDTGMACVFIRLGQDVHLTGGLLSKAVDDGVRIGYETGYLRKSVVADPLRRKNTGDNTPAMLHTTLVEGDKVTITVAPKGFGSENMSAVKMLKPSDGVEGIKRFVVETAEKAGPNPCPPMVVGVGIGGTFDACAHLAKKALLRPLNVHHADPYYAALEETLLTEINGLGIGPQGFGGSTTALGVAIEVLPTHIAALPCAVNISCHVTRHATEVL